MSAKLFSVTTKWGTYTIGQHIKTGLPGGPYRNWTVPRIEEKDDGWITVHLERVPEEVRERTNKTPGSGWLDCHSGLCMPPHWITAKLYIEEPNNVPAL